MTTSKANIVFFRGCSTQITSFVAVIGLCLTTSSAPVLAQQPSESAQQLQYAEPSAEQLELNDKAVTAIINDDYARAVALLEEARLLGEVNIIYLNLGRAYQKLGKCQKARQALQRSKIAPAVRSPAPALVRRKADDYLAELDVQCEEEEGTLGEHGAGEEREENEASGASTVAAPAPAVSSAKPWEWAVLGSGAAVALGGVGVHLLAEAKRADVTEPQAYEGGVNVVVTQQEAAALEDEANTLDNLALGMVIAGGVTVGVGTYLLLSGGDEPASDVSVQLNTGGASLVWSARF